MTAKFSNCRQLIHRTLHDNAELREDEDIQKVLEVLKEGIDKVYKKDCKISWYLCKEKWRKMFKILQKSVDSFHAI